MKRPANLILALVALTGCNGLDSGTAASSLTNATLLSAEEAQAEAEKSIQADDLQSELEALEKELAADEAGG